MHNNIFDRLVLAATCSLLVGCAPNSKSTSQKTTEAADNTPQEIHSWRAVYFDWEAGEVAPDEACAHGRVTLTSDHTLQVRDCNEVREAKINAVEFAQFEQELQPILESVDRPVTCSGVAIADYSQNWKLVDQNGRAIQVFQFNMSDTCGRVADVNELNDYLYDLKEQYFPRVEEGEYQD